MVSSKKKYQEVEKPEGFETPVYVHINEFLAEKPEIESHIKDSFRVFMKGKSYLHSYEAFEEELINFFNRKI